MLPRVVRHILSGYVLLEDVVAFVGGVLAMLALAAWLTGCGASAIQAQARAATVATVALEGAHRLALEETERRLDGCTDVPCTVDVERQMAPVVAAYETARLALVGWVEALHLSALADGGQDVVGALLVAGARWLAVWASVASALAEVGVEVPALPGAILGPLEGTP
jgi:hypothetical protein